MSCLSENALTDTTSLLKKIEGQYKVKLPEIQIDFDLRGQSAGQVRLQPGVPPIIRYNLVLLQENPELFLKRTIPHEVAHVAARTIHGPRIKPHGKEWQSIMVFLGADASRCHSFETTHLRARKLQTFLYRCDCREHQLTSIRHNRVKAGQQYLCSSCRTSLQPG
ncbi:MAG: hypothetical protein GY934_16860 [Gammaproteobacteria bacterium]|nr:hypothetical protein [Gammaproteobacteria bacterium]